MSMKVQTRQVDSITILDLSGRITLGEGSVTIRDAVRDVLAKGSNKILLNLGNITYIDSSGIGELVSAFTTVRNGGGELKLLNLTKKLHRLRCQGRRGFCYLFVHEVNISLARSIKKGRRDCDGLFFCRGSVRFVYFEKSTFGATLFSGLPLKYSSR